MTSAQKRLIRESFPALREVAGPLVQLFYGRLFQIAPSVRPMFRRDIGIQARKFSDMLEALVEGLLRLSQLVTDFPEIVEMDLNPLAVFPKGGGTIAMDARLSLRQ